jgi:hypothetical protein
LNTHIVTSILCHLLRRLDLRRVTIGYNNEELQSIPQASILGVGCGAPLHFADVKEGETIVDLDSGAGIDVFCQPRKLESQVR